jgi:hypothetical protein
MCISEGLVNQVVCTSENCQKVTHDLPPTPVSKEDTAILPCTPLLYVNGSSKPLLSLAIDITTYFPYFT